MRKAQVPLPLLTGDCDERQIVCCVECKKIMHKKTKTLIDQKIKIDNKK